MNYVQRQWPFIEDMNFDGTMTISDTFLWFKWLFFYPGDLFIKLIIDEFPEIASFFEVDYTNYVGMLSGTVSLFAWLCVIGVDLGCVHEVPERKAYEEY